MSTIDLTQLMSELLNKDRLDYIEIIAGAENGIRSIEVTEKILERNNITDTDKIKKENIKVNKRLRKLVDYGILFLKERGKYNISSLGFFLLDSWKELNEKTETIKKFYDFFDSHFFRDLPKEVFRQIYKLKGAAITENSVQWENEVKKYMKKIERKFYNLTEYIHDFPEEIIEKKESGEIEKIVIIYEFNKYPELNYSDERKELLDRLANAEAEFRYLTLEGGKHPIGIRIVDEKWATFNLTRIADGRLDRGNAFIGTDLDFISWCRDLIYHIWHFEARPLDVNEILEKRKK